MESQKGVKQPRIGPGTLLLNEKQITCEAFPGTHPGKAARALRRACFACGVGVARQARPPFGKVVSLTADCWHGPDFSRPSSIRIAFISVFSVNLGDQKLGPLRTKRPVFWDPRGAWGCYTPASPDSLCRPSPGPGWAAWKGLCWARSQRRPLPATPCALLTAPLPAPGKGIARPWKLVYYRAKKMFDVNNYKGR